MAKTEGKGTQIANTNTVALAEAGNLDEELLAFMGEFGKEGKEQIRSEDISIPRIALIQAMSPQVRERKAGIGDLYNIITGANYGQEMLFIPLFFFTTQIMWESRDPGANIVCQARDGENGTKFGACNVCPNRQFVDGEQPKCTTFKNILLLPYAEGVPLDQQQPAVFSAKRSGIKEVTLFTTNATQQRFNGRELPLYMGVWKLRTVEEKNDGNVYFVPKFDLHSIVRNIEQVKWLQGLYRVMKQSQAKFDINVDGPGETSEAIDANFQQVDSDRY